MKTIAKTNLSNCECSVHETFYQIFTKLNVGRIFLAVYSVNTNLAEERVELLIPEKELSRLVDERPNTFKRTNIDRYIEIPSATLCN